MSIKLAPLDVQVPSSTDLSPKDKGLPWKDTSSLVSSPPGTVEPLERIQSDERRYSSPSPTGSAGDFNRRFRNVEETDSDDMGDSGALGSIDTGDDGGDEFIDTSRLVKRATMAEMGMSSMSENMGGSGTFPVVPKPGSTPSTPRGAFSVKAKLKGLLRLGAFKSNAESTSEDTVQRHRISVTTDDGTESNEPISPTRRMSGSQNMQRAFVKTGAVMKLKDRLTSAMWEAVDLTKYVPKSLTKILDGSPALPALKKSRGAVLFADMSGYSSLFKKFDSNFDGSDGIGSTLNEFFEKLIKIVYSSRYGGDVIKFAGDAVLVTFACVNEKKEEELAARAVLALQCAFDMIDSMKNYKTRDGTRLRLHVGIGVGQILEVCCGLSDRAEHFVVGDAVQQATDEASRASASECCASKEVCDLIQSYGGELDFGTSSENKVSSVSLSQKLSKSVEDLNLDGRSAGMWDAIFQSVKDTKAASSELVTSSWSSDEEDENTTDDRILSFDSRGESPAQTQSPIPGGHSPSGSQRKRSSAWADSLFPISRGSTDSRRDSGVLIDADVKQGITVGDVLVRRSKSPPRSSVDTEDGLAVPKGRKERRSVAVMDMEPSSPVALTNLKANSLHEPKFSPRTRRKLSAMAQQQEQPAARRHSDTSTSGASRQPIPQPVFSRLPVEKLTQFDGLDTLEEDKVQIPVLRSFVPRHVNKIISAGQQRYIGDKRKITTIFILVTSRLDVKVSRQLSLFNKAVVESIRAMDEQEGIVRQVMMDDKGTVIICGLGLVAHDNDEERAIKAAIDIQSSLVKNLGINTKIGVATGPTFCGLMGSERRCEYALIGPSVVMAARLMSNAENNSVFCDEATASKVNGMQFDEQFLRVKGVSEPVKSFQPRTESTYHPYVLPTQEGRPPIVGRERHMTLIKATVQRLVNRKSGSLVVLQGEPGIGKSAMIAETIDMFKETFGVLYGASLFFEQSTPYFTWRSIFRDCLLGGTLSSAVGAVMSNEEEVSEEKIHKTLRHRAREVCPNWVEYLPLLNNVLMTSLPQTETTRELPKEAKPDLIKRMMLAVLKGAAQKQPKLLVLEDVQWMDQSSMEFFQLLASALEHLPILVVVGTRPSEKIQLYSRKVASSVVLDLLPLDAITIGQLIQKLLQVRYVSPDVSTFIFELTEGNPFFATELLYVLLERGVLLFDGGVLSMRKKGSLATGWLRNLPATFGGLITSRFDRLPLNQQMVLKIASVIGQPFELNIVKAVYTGSDQEALGEAIQPLVASRMLDKIAGAELYQFRNVVARDTVYGLLSTAIKKELHGNIANYLTQMHEKDLRGYFGLIAHHFQRSGNTTMAMEYLEKAGLMALESYAMRDAQVFFSDLLQIAPHTAVTLLKLSKWYNLLGRAFFRNGFRAQARQCHLHSLELAGIRVEFGLVESYAIERQLRKRYKKMQKGVRKKLARRKSSVFGIPDSGKVRTEPTDLAVWDPGNRRYRTTGETAGKDWCHKAHLDVIESYYDDCESKTCIFLTIQAAKLACENAGNSSRVSLRPSGTEEQILDWALLGDKSRTELCRCYSWLSAVCGTLGKEDMAIYFADRATNLCNGLAAWNEWTEANEARQRADSNNTCTSGAVTPVGNPESLSLSTARKIQEESHTPKALDVEPQTPQDLVAAAAQKLEEEEAGGRAQEKEGEEGEGTGEGGEGTGEGGEGTGEEGEKGHGVGEMSKRLETRDSGEVDDGDVSESAEGPSSKFDMSVVSFVSSVTSLGLVMYGDFDRVIQQSKKAMQVFEGLGEEHGRFRAFQGSLVARCLQGHYKPAIQETNLMLKDATDKGGWCDVQSLQLILMWRALGMLMLDKIDDAAQSFLHASNINNKDEPGSPSMSATPELTRSPSVQSHAVTETHSFRAMSRTESVLGSVGLNVSDLLTEAQLDNAFDQDTQSRSLKVMVSGVRARLHFMEGNYTLALTFALLTMIDLESCKGFLTGNCIMALFSVLDVLIGATELFACGKLVSVPIDQALLPRSKMQKLMTVCGKSMKSSQTRERRKSLVEIDASDALFDDSGEGLGDLPNFDAQNESDNPLFYEEMLNGAFKVREAIHFSSRAVGYVLKYHHEKTRIVTMPRALTAKGVLLCLTRKKRNVVKGRKLLEQARLTAKDLQMPYDVALACVKLHLYGDDAVRSFSLLEEAQSLFHQCCCVSEFRQCRKLRAKHAAAHPDLEPKNENQQQSRQHRTSFAGQVVKVDDLASPTRTPNQPFDVTPVATPTTPVTKLHFNAAPGTALMSVTKEHDSRRSSASSSSPIHLSPPVLERRQLG